MYLETHLVVLLSLMESQRLDLLYLSSRQGKTERVGKRHTCSQVLQTPRDKSPSFMLPLVRTSHVVPPRCKGGWEMKYSCASMKRKQAWWPSSQSLLYLAFPYSSNFQSVILATSRPPKNLLEIQILKSHTDLQNQKFWVILVILMHAEVWKTLTYPNWYRFSTLPGYTLESPRET